MKFINDYLIIYKNKQEVFLKDCIIIKNFIDEITE